MQTRSGRNKVMVVGMFFMTAAAFIAPFMFLRNREAGKVFNKRSEDKSEEAGSQPVRSVAPARTGGVTNVSGNMVMPANGDTAAFERELSEEKSNPLHHFQINYKGENGKVRAMSGTVNKPAKAVSADGETAKKTSRLPAAFRELEILHEQRSRLEAANQPDDTFA